VSYCPPICHCLYLIDIIDGWVDQNRVKLGEDEVTKERWALKLLKKERIADLKQVDREITAMTKVRHPNVLLMKEVDRDATYTRSDGKREEVILTVLELASGELVSHICCNYPPSVVTILYHTHYEYEQYP
jgi:serine/threonine protein kinase